MNCLFCIGYQELMMKYLWAALRTFVTAEVFPPHTRTERGLPKPIIFMKIKLFTKRPVRHVSKGFALGRGGGLP